MVKKLLALVLISGLFITACDLEDLDVDIDIPEEAEAPDFSKIEMNTGAFDDAQEKANPVSSAEFDMFAENVALEYEVAASLVNTLVTQLNLITLTLSNFMDPIANIDPDFSGGIFTWSYTAQIALLQSSVDIELQAAPGVSSITWLGLISGNILGEQVENYELVSGTTSPDGDSGDLDVNFGEAGSGVNLNMNIVWQLTNDELTELNLAYTNSGVEGPSDIEYSYVVDGSVAEIVGSTTTDDGTVSYTITWDTDTGAGSISTNELGTVCWDSAKEKVDC